MPCPPPMDAGRSSQGKKTMSRGAGKKSSSSSSSWVARSMGFYPSSSSGNRAQPAAAVPAVTEGKNSDNDKISKKKRSVSISRSMACASSICSTKESSVLSRDRSGGRSASSRSLRAPDVDVDAVYAASAAAVSATSSFNSEATAATSSSATTVTSASSPLSSALSSPVSSFGSSFRGMPIRKLSGCYECHSVFDPRSFAAAFPCTDCGEVFGKAESLELHKATRHAVSDLGPEDTSRNIVEIIFQSSWLRKQAPVCKIDRILKVQNSDRTVKRFEQYKESIKERASGEEGKKNARCVADGNELLRFHCTTFTCSLGAGGGTALCQAPATQCKLCAIIRDGFRVDGDGRIATMATSGRAHDMAQGISDGEKKAMLVCRVVAGRVKKASDTKPSEDYDCDSVSPSSEGVYSDLDELFVFNRRAILPCFVVIYSGY
ncbi:hypothetical protein SEVIR_8G048000v4 [Setaria viridis]|uniref:C2H2-type domain-containing protein n=1 Tax=Setaria viridis TaxID=4556 RepID=A0A4U6TBR9_SETVI|nr:uncharacterized protein LOC117866781 isoform X1 [Setaria viridis]TKV99490.1 hypothetical protein SEVIR_8G048000v2 [Setaria viridis]